MASSTNKVRRRKDRQGRDGLIWLREFGGAQNRVSEPLRIGEHSRLPLVSPPVSSLHDPSPLNSIEFYPQPW